MVGSMKRTLTFLLLACGLLSPQMAWAQSKVGTTILQFLKIEPGARGAAMGNAGAALSGGIDAVYFNAGVIGVISDAAVTFTHSAWFADISYDYAAAALPVAEKLRHLLNVPQPPFFTHALNNCLHGLNA
jgi:hypothetical protein